MKQRLPLILSMIIGMLAIAVFYIPAKFAGDLEDTLLSWGQVLATAALILGGINIVQVNYPKIRRRERDWQYKVLLLVSAAVMLLAGIPWHRLGNDRPVASVTISDQRDDQLAASSQGMLRLSAADDGVMVSVNGAIPVPVPTMEAVEVVVPSGKNEVRVFAGTTDFTIAGYEGYSDAIEVGAGDVVRVGADLQMHWGLKGRVFTWLYDHVFDPCNSTMFALLAFFIASAAFRAFRARNIEAALLLGAAILVMLGRVPIGSLLSDAFPLIADWMVDVPNNAGRRAIMMGAALGAVSTGLRVILGLERSHLGAD